MASRRNRLGVHPPDQETKTGGLNFLQKLAGRLRRTLDQQFHRTVRLISNVSSHGQIMGDPGRLEPKADTLNPTRKTNKNRN